MGTETGLALRPQGGALEISTLTDVERLATLAVASGLVQVRRAEEAAMLLITGRELGLSPMQSLRGIYVVNGRLVLSADLLVAIVRGPSYYDPRRHAERAREPGHRRLVVERLERQLLAEITADAGDRLQREQRVAAEIEKIVMNAHLRQTKHLRPLARQPRFHVRAGCNERL